MKNRPTFHFDEIEMLTVTVDISFLVHNFSARALEVEKLKAGYTRDAGFEHQTVSPVNFVFPYYLCIISSNKIYNYRYLLYKKKINFAISRHFWGILSKISISLGFPHFENRLS